MTKTTLSLLTALGIFTFGCDASTGGTRRVSGASDGTLPLSTTGSLPPGIADTAGGIHFMSCVSKLDGGDDDTVLRVGGGRYLLCTSYDNDDGQGTQEVQDDNGQIWDITWTYDTVTAGGPTDQVVLQLVTNVVGQPWVVKATRDGDEVTIPIPTWSGAEASPIWIDVGGKVISWAPAS
jgi:hypothetical protein